MKKFTTEEIRDLLNQVYREEISFSRMVEILNEMVSETEDIPEGLEKGDLAIFWDNEKEFAVIKPYGRPDGGEEDYFQHRDQNGFRWRNAIKFESKEQFNRLIKGGEMIHKDKQEKWFSNDTSTATVKAETVMPLKGKCYAVYPDTVRMGLSGVNECMAIFKDRRQAVRFGSSEWRDKWILKEVSL